MSDSDPAEDPPVVKVLFGDLIPGETPIDDIGGLKIPGIQTRVQLRVREAENIGLALVDYLQQRRPEKRKRVDFDLDGVRAVHRDMFCDVWEWAGQFRLKDIDSVPFASKFYHIQQRLHDLLEDLKVWPITGDAIEPAARLHHLAVQIHPFPNGNGRWSRLLTNIWLLEKQKNTVDWPDDMTRESPIRNEYITALKAADNGDYNALIALHQRFLPNPPRPVIVRPPDDPSMFGQGGAIHR